MEPQQSQRLFIGIPCPPEVENCLRQNTRVLKRQIGDPTLRWSKPAQWHLTLRFLGDVREGEIPGLCDALQIVAEKESGMELHLHQPGCFPDWSRPRAFWIGLDGHLEALLRLQAAIELAAQEIAGKSEERTYIPHLTVARTRTPSRRLGTRFKEEADKLEWNASWPVGGFELIQSRLGSEGPVYRTVRSFQLD